MLDLRRIVAAPPDHDAEHRVAPGAPASYGAAGRADDAGWEPPIVRTVALRNEGTAELVHAIEAHRAHLERTGGLRARDVARARAGFVALLRERLLAGAIARLEAEEGRLDDVAARIAAREADPYALADELVARLGA
jgi:LAO/AO transport system kinase